MLWNKNPEKKSRFARAARTDKLSVHVRCCVEIADREKVHKYFEVFQ